jgi:hypothetical protein
MAADKSFKLTANLEIKATNLDAIAKRITSVFSSVKGTINIGANFSQLDTAKAKLDAIKAMVAAHSKKPLLIKIGVVAPKKKDVGDINTLNRALAALQPVIDKMKTGGPLRIAVHARGLDAKSKQARELAKALARLTIPYGQELIAIIGITLFLPAVMVKLIFSGDKFSLKKIF